MSRAQPDAGGGGSGRFPPLRSARLALEPITRRHAGEMYEGLRDAKLYEFIPEDPPRDRAALEQRYEALARGLSADGSELWLNWFLRRDEDGACIGYVQATVLTAQRRALVAYLLLAHAWGHGYAREAVETVAAHLFAQHGVDRVEALIDTRNARSVRLVETLGFERVERIDKADHFKGADSDEYRYRLARR